MSTDYEKLQDEINGLREQIKELKEYGISVYEAIRMFSEDYMDKVNHGTVALHNGILSQLSKHDFVAEHIQEKWAKQEKWIVHRTLRTKGIEVYVNNAAGYLLINHLVGYYWLPDDFGEDIFSSEERNLAYLFNRQSAIEIRDMLNRFRQGRRYLWVISKVQN